MSELKLCWCCGKPAEGVKAEDWASCPDEDCPGYYGASWRKWNHRAPIPATPDRMADVTLGAEAMLDAKAECNCHAHSWEEHTDECAACNGMGYKSILIQKDNPLHVPDCPICHGTGKPSQGEGDK